MIGESSRVYSSGETVALAGVYEVVGINRAKATTTGEFSIRHLNIGDLFPSYRGRAVNWHLVPTPETNAEPVLASAKPSR